MSSPAMIHKCLGLLSVGPGAAGVGAALPSGDGERERLVGRRGAFSVADSERERLLDRGGGFVEAFFELPLFADGEDREEEPSSE